MTARARGEPDPRARGEPDPRARGEPDPRARGEPDPLAHLPAFGDDTLCRALLDGMLDPVITIDGAGVVQHASRSVRTVLGYEPTEIVGKNISLLMPEPHKSAHDGYLAHYRTTGQTGILGRTREFQVFRKSGELRDVELSVSRVDPPGGAEPIFIGSFRDVTDRNRLQRREVSMLRALATLGESTAALVHEIKNPITAVNMALRAVADQLGENQQQVLEELVGRMRRLELQLRQSLGYVRPLDLRARTCEAGALFDDVGRVLRPLLTKARVTLEADVEPGTPRFRADPRCLSEVLCNLVANAMEACEAGGHVRLTSGATGDGQVWLRVEDDGPGIPPGVRTTLFQPFVTTKADGTGLGLPICRRIIEEHGGGLEAEERSEMGGASFRILLPVGGPSGAVRDQEQEEEHT